MRRREFLTCWLCGGRRAARGTRPAVNDARDRVSRRPIVGHFRSLFRSLSSGPERKRLRRRPERFHRVSLGEWTNNRLPGLAANFVDRPVNVLFTGGSLESSLAAKAAISTIPIVFVTGSDPVKYGVVASLNRPGGNVTGIAFLATNSYPSASNSYKRSFQGRP